MVEMRYVKTSKPIDISEWEFGFGDFHEIISRSLTEALTNTLNNHPPCIELPFMWAYRGHDGRGGKAVTDPLTLYLTLPLDISTDGECAWEVSLSEVIEDELELIDRDRATQISAALRDLADKLDKIEDE